MLENEDLVSGTISLVWDTLEALGYARGETTLRHPDWPRVEVHVMEVGLVESIRPLVSVGQRIEEGDELIVGSGGIGEAVVAARCDGTVAEVIESNDNVAVRVFRGIDVPTF